MPTSAPKKLRVGDVAEFTARGHYADKGDIVRVLKIEGPHVKVHALKWDHVDKPEQFEFEEGIWLFMRDLRIKVCMFPGDT